MFSLFGVEQVGRNLAEVPDQTQPREGFQNVIGDVDFPPEEALAGCRHVVVVVVVPAFAQHADAERLHRAHRRTCGRGRRLPIKMRLQKLCFYINPLEIQIERRL